MPGDLKALATCVLANGVSDEMVGRTWDIRTDQLYGQSSDRTQGLGRVGQRTCAAMFKSRPNHAISDLEAVPFQRETFARTGVNYNDDMPKDHRSWSKMFDEKMQLKAEVASLEIRMASIAMALEFRHDETDLLVEELEHKKKSLVEITKKLRSVS